MKDKLDKNIKQRVGSGSAFLYINCEQREGDPASVGPGQGPDHLGRDQDRARTEADSCSAPSFQIHEQVIHRTRCELVY